MRAGVEYCRGLSFEGLCVGHTRRDLAGRRHSPPGGSPPHHHAGPRVAAAVPFDIAVGAYCDHRRRLLAFSHTGNALPMALDGDGGRHDRQRSLPVDRNTLVAWTGHRLVCRPRKRRLPVLGTWSLCSCGPVTPCARVDQFELSHAEL